MQTLWSAAQCPPPCLQGKGKEEEATQTKTILGGRLRKREDDGFRPRFLNSPLVSRCLASFKATFCKSTRERNSLFPVPFLPLSSWLPATPCLGARGPRCTPHVGLPCVLAKGVVVSGPSPHSTHSRCRAWRGSQPHATSKPFLPSPPCLGACDHRTSSPPSLPSPAHAQALTNT